MPIRKPWIDGKVSELATVDGLAGWSERDRAFLAKVGDECLLPAGTVLVTEGDRPRWTYLILDGCVGVSRDGEVMGTLGPGSLCGDVPSLSHRGSTRSLTTLADTRALVFGRREFLGALHTNPALAGMTLRSLANQLADSDEAANRDRQADGSVGAADCERDMRLV